MPIKVRDLEANIAKMGVENGLKYSVVQLIEQGHADREAISNLAEMLNQMSDIVMSFASIGHQQQKELSDVKKTMGIDDGGDDGAQSRNG